MPQPSVSIHGGGCDNRDRARTTRIRYTSLGGSLNEVKERDCLHRLLGPILPSPCGVISSLSVVFNRAEASFTDIQPIVWASGRTIEPGHVFETGRQYRHNTANN